MKIFNSVLAVSCLLFASISLAIPVLSIDPTSNIAASGTPISVDINITNLGGQVVGVFDIALTWNSTILDFDSVTFDSFLDGPLNSIQSTTLIPGGIDVVEISLGDLSNQIGLDTFRLFTATFIGRDAGTTNLIADGTLGDAFGGGLDVVFRGATFEISAPASVPEPNPLALIAIPITGTFWLRRKHSLRKT